jgi:hypothetical protein
VCAPSCRRPSICRPAPSYWMRIRQHHGGLSLPGPALAGS